MITLILMRHAKSDRPEGVEDFDRPLSDRGRTDAQAVGQWLRDTGPMPQKSLVSEAKRTRETWEELGLEDECPVRLLKELYDASPSQMLGAIGRQQANTILVIGHNPTVESLARHLLRDEEDVPERLSRWSPGTVAILEFDTDDWDDVGKMSGRLKDFVAPAQLRQDQGADQSAD